MTLTQPLMPKATAVWLVENTSMSFEQIADFCKIHPLEVKAIADGEAAQTIKGMDPVLTGQLTREDIARAEADPSVRLKVAESKVRTPIQHKGPRYTPVSRRQDRPNAILWLLRNHPELKDAAIMRLVGTTKPTIESIRSRTHWNANSLQPLDPVTLGLCSQIDLDFEVERASRTSTSPAPVVASGPTLLPASETTTVAAQAAAAANVRPDRSEKRAEADEADAVLAKLKSMKGAPQKDEEERR
jgi:uncharacterized protein